MGNKSFKKLPYGLASTFGSTLILLSSFQVSAQEAGESRYQLEEIMITARRVDEGLQNAPIAVTAVSGLELENRGAVDIVDFADIAPNVSLKTDGTTSGFAAAPRVSIRGVGQSDFVINTDPAVGMYVDGVYLGRSLGSITDLVDVERVEALRGPQGTLFGRNSTGGAINIISKKPEVGGDLAGYATVGLGENGYALFRASANIPLGDTTAARVSVLKRERDGFIPALQYDDLDLGAEDVSGLKAAFRWEPNESFTLELDADFSKRSDTAAPFVPVRIGDLSVGETNLDTTGLGTQQTGISTSVFARRYNGEALTPPIPGDFAALGYISGDANCSTTQAYRDSNLSCLGNAWAGSRDGSNQAWFDGEGNMIRPDNQDLDAYGYSARMTWEAESFTINSISAWRGFESSFLNGSPAAIYLASNINENFEQDQFSQEITINGDFNDRISWIAGAFYQEEDGVEVVRTVFPLAPAAGNNDRDFLPTAGVEDRNVDNTSEAFFGQLSIDVTETLALTLGGRQTEDNKEVLINKVEEEEGVISTVLEGEKNIKESSFLVNLAWNVTDDAMLYGQFSDGFRNGGFPARTPAGSGLDFNDVQYDPEFVESIEFGLKTTALDGRLRANFAVFSSDYTDQQINATALDPTTGGNVATIANIGESKISGFEVEANYVVTDNFRIDSSIGYLDAKLEEITTGDGQFIINTGTNLQKIITNDSDITLPHAPEWQINLGANYSYFMDSGAEFRNRIDVFYESEQFSSIANYDLNKVDATTRLNYVLTYTPVNDPWELTFGVRNLTDEEDVVNTSVNTGPGTAVYNVFGRGREAYLQYTYRFGE